MNSVPEVSCFGIDVQPKLSGELNLQKYVHKSNCNDMCLHFNKEIVLKIYIYLKQTLLNEL